MWQTNPLERFLENCSRRREEADPLGQFRLVTSAATRFIEPLQEQRSNFHHLLVFRHEHLGFRFHLAKRFGMGQASFQNLRNISRAVENTDDVQPARRGGDAVENQIIREPAHRPETHPGQSGTIGLIARPDLRPLGQRAEA